MIQIGTSLKVIDNSGAKEVYCIGIHLGFTNQRYAHLGHLILTVVSSLRKRRRQFSKVKKGSIVLALIVRTKVPFKTFDGSSVSFLENSVVLISNTNKLLGTRIFGLLPRMFRYTKYMRMLSLSKGIK